ncbi:MAG: hypothetical protein WA936_06035 [Erythrobacter sp.]|uniref:hypothetical protein n=1 Tax=Erythrobacter sp. TaxID=1042 RepID=UPI003C75B975
MVQERVTQTEDARGNVHTTHVISNDAPPEGGGSAKWVFLLVLIVALAVGGYLIAQSTGAEIARDNAIAGAAEEVGSAASEVGSAAGEVADEATQR